MSRFKDTGEFEINSIQYIWRVRHYAGASTAYENHRGISVSVSLKEKIAKELIIDFPVKDYFFSTRPKSTAEFKERLVKCVYGALELGWNPESKGKPFRVSSVDAEAITQK